MLGDELAQCRHDPLRLLHVQVRGRLKHRGQLADLLLGPEPGGGEAGGEVGRSGSRPAGSAHP
jgi:hypothetical protein